MLHLSYLLWHLVRGHFGSYLVMFMVELFVECNIHCVPCVSGSEQSKVHSFGIKIEETVASNAATAQSYHDLSPQSSLWGFCVVLCGILQPH